MNAEASERPTIVVGVDGSEASRRALQWAARQAGYRGAELNVVTTWEFPTTFGWAPPYPPDFDPEADTRKALEDTVADVLGPSPEIPVRLTVVEGHPAPVLVKKAEGAELLVVGSRGHGAFVGMVIGSVSEHCAAHAPCPVVVVRHPDDKE
ncbi:MAG: universal stress protein [Acidimicrobiales bacterium]|jgi:nucleotide-binding universal stress UspA family protein